MKRPSLAPVVLPLALAAPLSANAHDQRFADEPTENALQVALSTFTSTLNTVPRGNITRDLNALGVEVCLPTHGNRVVDYKPCIRGEWLMIPLDDKASFVFDFTRFELDVHETDGWYVEWGFGVRAQDNRKARMVGYNADLLVGWRTDSHIEGVGMMVAAGPTSTGLISTKRIPKKLLDADADARLDLNGFRADGDLGAFFPEREAGIWNGLVVKVGYTF